MKSSRILGVLLIFLVGVVLNSCGGGQTTAPPPGQPSTGTVAVLGTDAPMPNVLAFRVTLTGLTVSDGTNTVPLIPGPQEVEFSRLNGLRTLLSLQSVPVGTYTSFTATLASPVISILDTSVTPPVVQVINGTLTQATVNVTFPQPLVVTANGLVNVVVDLRLADSLMVDASGNLTGQVRPRIFIRAVPPDAPEAEIDELRGGVVSVNVAGNSFVIQGPYGRELTVVVDAQTHWSEGDSLATLDTNSIVGVSGSIQRGTLTLRATEVVVLSRDRFFVGGLITYVQPTPGPADSVDVLVRGEIPDLSGVQVGQISTFGFDGNERFLIHDLQLPFAPFLFNRASLVAGQRVAIGGALSGNSLDVRRVILHQQGLDGHWVPGTTVGGSFRMRVAGVTGALFGEPVRVFTSDRTRFVGLSGAGDLNGDNPIPLRVVGLVLQDDVTGKPIVIARIVEKLTPIL